MAVAADPITTEVVRNFVISCAQDMNAALYRSAFSPIIYEGRDSAVVLLDEHGNMLGQSTGVPLFVGAIDAAVKIVMQRYGDDMAPGDIFILNDSYLQGTHLHDITAVGPLFHEGELVGFGAARAHWQDIGGIDPGTTMGSTSIFHEGLRLGPDAHRKTVQAAHRMVRSPAAQQPPEGERDRRSQRANHVHPHRRKAA